MSEPASEPARWTPARAAAFLKHLSEHGNAARAAREVGMSRKSAYALRARAPEFARLWLVAVSQARTMREVTRLRRKAVHPLLDRQAFAGEARGVEKGLATCAHPAPKPGDTSGRDG